MPKVSPNPSMPIEIRPVANSNWSDLETLFESRGGPHNCWCMAWRANEFKSSLPGKPGKKASLKARVDRGEPIGIIAYAEGEPVGWCSVGPRETYRSLGGDESKEEVWSLVCFFVKRSLRRQGIGAQLLDYAEQSAREQGAQYLEAYPVKRDSPSYRFMGFVPDFERAGFTHVRSAGSRRHVMIKPLVSEETYSGS